MNKGYMIRPATLDDTQSMLTIYTKYVTDCITTFEERPPSFTDFRQRLSDNITLGLPWFVVTCDQHCLGYAYAKHYHKRDAYRCTFEWSIYLEQGSQGKGIGSKLFSAVTAACPDLNAIVAVITLPGTKASKVHRDAAARSIEFHSRCGFQKCGHLPRVGYKFGLWHDIVFMLFHPS